MMQQGEGMDTTLSMLISLHIDGHTLADGQRSESEDLPADRAVAEPSDRMLQLS
jgi:hypothetical protein